MEEKRQWKAAAGYLIGGILLAAAVAAAWFGPERFAQWQDERMTGQITLSSREDIHFLDVASLDLEGRLKMLGSCETIDWIEYTEVYFDVDAKLGEAKKSIALWAEHGLLPETARLIAENAQVEDIRVYGLLLDETAALPLCLFRLGDEGTDVNAMTVVMDADKDILYYASITGEVGVDYLLRSLGYDSLAPLDEMYWENRVETREEVLKLLLGNADESLREETAQYDFAGVCGAESAQITKSDLDLALDVQLQFDTFEARAGRYCVETDAGLGMAVFLGTEEWFVTPILDADGYVEYRSNIEEQLVDEILIEYGTSTAVNEDVAELYADE